MRRTNGSRLVPEQIPLIWDISGSEESSQPYDQKRKKLFVGSIKHITLSLHLLFISPVRDYAGNFYALVLCLFIPAVSHKVGHSSTTRIVGPAFKSAFHHSSSNNDWINKYSGIFRKMSEYILPLGTYACVYKQCMLFIIDHVYIAD